MYAEDPARGFLPTGGRALLLREPTGEGVRVDSSLLEGEPVGTTYDPMLSKVVAWGPDRPTALARLDRALAGTVLLGVGTNTTFLRALLAHPDVQAGRLDTGLLERSLDELVPTGAARPGAGRRRPAPAAGPAAAGNAVDRADRLAGARPGTAALGCRGDGERRAGAGRGDRHGRRGRRRGAGRRGGARGVGGRVLPDGLLLTLDGRTVSVATAVDGATTWVARTAGPGRWSRRRRAGAGGRGRADAQVRSPMPGAVVAVHVATGDVVEAGDAAARRGGDEDGARPAGAAGRDSVELHVGPGDQVVVDQPVAVGPRWGR